MANTIPSPDMNMPIPVVDVDPGPDWANNVNSCLSVIDGHTHTSGSGVPITPQAININSDLPVNNNNLVTVRSLRFQPQGSPVAGAADLGCLYEQGIDLFYVDGAGKQVRITQGGTVSGSSGTITGLPSGTASASFSTGTFTFQSATNTPAAMNFGPFTTGQQVAGGFNVTLSVSGTQATNYNLVWPTAIATANQSAIVSDVAGNLGYFALAPGTDTVYNLAVTPATYRVGTTYNAVLLDVTSVSNLGAFTPSSDSPIIPYQTSDGSWHLRFCVQLTSTSNVNNGIFNISGVSFKGVTSGLNQAVTVAGVSGPSIALGYTFANTGNIQIIATTNETIWSISGDVELNSKPTWAN